MTQFVKLFELVGTLVSSGSLPCAVVGVSDANGHTLGLQAFGQRPDGSMATASDPYHLFSISKPITALVVLRLVEQGLLSLAQDVSKFCPRADRKPVPLWALLSHTSGLPEGSWLPSGSLHDELRRANPLFAPGDHWSYSNLAFVALSELVEDVTGKSFEQNLREMVECCPGCEGISFHVPDNVVPLSGIDPLTFDYDRFVAMRHPAAGLVASAPNLLALGSALLGGNNSIVHQRTLAASLRAHTLLSPRLLEDPLGTRVQWGLGWTLPESGVLDTNCFGHGGWSGCLWMMYPKRGLCLTFMTAAMDLETRNARLDRIFNVFAACD